MRIAVTNLKGGSGKTSTAVLLAEAAAERGESVLLIDADPQGSSMAWSDEAAEYGDGLRSVVVPLPTPDLQGRLERLAPGHDHIVIDTPPGALRIVQAAIRAVDVVLVPCRPSLLDLSRLAVTIEVVADIGRPSAVLLTNARAGTRASAGARAALDAAEYAVLDVAIPQREAIAASYGTRPTTLVLAPYTAVLEELEAHLTPKETNRGRPNRRADATHRRSPVSPGSGGTAASRSRAVYQSGQEVPAAHHVGPDGP